MRPNSPLERARTPSPVGTIGAASDKLEGFRVAVGQEGNGPRSCATRTACTDLHGSEQKVGKNRRGGDRSPVGTRRPAHLFLFLIRGGPCRQSVRPAVAGTPVRGL